MLTDNKIIVETLILSRIHAVAYIFLICYILHICKKNIIAENKLMYVKAN